MSDLARSALPGARSTGMVSVREAGLCGMVSLRCDLEAGARIVAEVTGCAMPQTRRITSGGGVQVAWMSPDEVMILCPHGEAPGLVARLSEAFGTAHHLALDLSDARALFVLEGEGAALRDVLAKVTPADMAADALPVGEMRRTRLQQVAGALWFESAGEARVICFRSVAQYVFDLLTLSARTGGEVGFHHVPS